MNVVMRQLGLCVIGFIVVSFLYLYCRSARLQFCLLSLIALLPMVWMSYLFSRQSVMRLLLCHVTAEGPAVLFLAFLGG